jgi:DNA-3-methyladenine glycosylase
MRGLKQNSSKSAIQPGSLPGRLLGREFFAHRSELVAPRLLGKLLVHGDMAGRIVEAEAYLGPHNEPPDPAAHSHRGPTPRNQVLFGLAGHAYVYSIYGRYFCLNVSCEEEGLAGCVLLRAMEPVAGVEAMARNRGLPEGVLESGRLLRQIASGPSRMCMALGILRTSHNGLDVTKSRSPLQIRDDGFRVAEALVTPRIGINPKNKALDWPLRFAVPGNACVSGPKNLKGRRVPIP